MFYDGPSYIPGTDPGTSFASGPYSPKSFTANAILLGNGTGAIQASGITAAANGLTFSGTAQINAASAGNVNLDLVPAGSGAVRVQGQLTANGTVVVQGASTPLVTSAASFNNGAGSSAGTLTNAPSVGNPTKWIAVSDNGTTRYIPAW